MNAVFLNYFSLRRNNTFLLWKYKRVSPGCGAWRWKKGHLQIRATHLWISARWERQVNASHLAGARETLTKLHLMCFLRAPSSLPRRCRTLCMMCCQRCRTAGANWTPTSTPWRRTWRSWGRASGASCRSSPAHFPRRTPLSATSSGRGRPRQKHSGTTFWRINRNPRLLPEGSASSWSVNGKCINY